MKITFIVTAQEGEYWDNDAVSEQVSVSSEADEELIGSALGVFPYLKKLTQIAIEKRINIRDQAEALAAIEDAALEAAELAAARLKEYTDEDSTNA